MVPIALLVMRPRGTSDLLVHMDGDDESTFAPDYGKFGHVVTFASTTATNGDPAETPALDTAQKKFGVSSLRCTKTGWVSYSQAGIFNLGANDFTIECWAYPTAFNERESCFISIGNAGRWLFTLFSNDRLSFYYNPSGGFIFAHRTHSGITLNTWHHFAVCRQGSAARLFLNGVQQGANIDLTGIDIGMQPTDTIDIGNFASAVTGHPSSYPQNFNGWIDEVRIIIGQALYTSNFTPPSAPFDL